MTDVKVLNSQWLRFGDALSITEQGYFERTFTTADSAGLQGILGETKVRKSSMNYLCIRSLIVRWILAYRQGVFDQKSGSN